MTANVPLGHPDGLRVLRLINATLQGTLLGAGYEVVAASILGDTITLKLNKPLAERTLLTRTELGESDFPTPSDASRAKFLKEWWMMSHCARDSDEGLFGLLNERDSIADVRELESGTIFLRVYPGQWAITIVRARVRVEYPDGRVVSPKPSAEAPYQFDDGCCYIPPKR